MPREQAKPAWVEALEATLLIAIGTALAATLMALFTIVMGVG